MSRPTLRGNAEYRALTTAIENTTPDCLDDDRFTADAWETEERGELTLICSACPIGALCLTYARTARPAAGFWAGRTWTTKKKEKEA